MCNSHLAFSPSVSLVQMMQHILVHIQLGRILILFQSFNFHMDNNLFIAVYALPVCMLTLLSIDEPLLPRYMNWLTNIYICTHTHTHLKAIQPYPVWFGWFLETNFWEGWLKSLQFEPIDQSVHVSSSLLFPESWHFSHLFKLIYWEIMNSTVSVKS